MPWNEKKKKLKNTKISGDKIYYIRLKVSTWIPFTNSKKSPQNTKKTKNHIERCVKNLKSTVQITKNFNEKRITFTI